MTWWVYKCNGTGRARADIRGDWATDFNWRANDCAWGKIEALPALRNLRPGHRIVAQQTDRKEIVGVLDVVRFEDGRLYLKPLIRFAGVNLGHLKKKYAPVRKMKAFAPGRIATIYPMSAADAKYLLRLCAVGLGRIDVEQLFHRKSLWRDVGQLRLPNPRWKLGSAADAWAEKLGLLPGAVKIFRPSGRPARSDKTLGALQQEWRKTQ